MVRTNRFGMSIILLLFLMFFMSCMTLYSENNQNRSIYVAESDPRISGIGLLFEYIFTERSIIKEINIYNFFDYPNDIFEAIDSSEKRLIAKYWVEKKDNKFSLSYSNYEMEEAETKSILDINIIDGDHFEVVKFFPLASTILIEKSVNEDSYRISKDNQLIYEIVRSKDSSSISYEKGSEIFTTIEDGRPVYVNKTGESVSRYAAISFSDEGVYTIKLFSGEQGNESNYGTVFLFDAFGCEHNILNKYLMVQNQWWYLNTFF